MSADRSVVCPECGHVGAYPHEPCDYPAEPRVARVIEEAEAAMVKIERRAVAQSIKDFNAHVELTGALDGSYRWEFEAIVADAARRASRYQRVYVRRRLLAALREAEQRAEFGSAGMELARKAIRWLDEGRSSAPNVVAGIRQAIVAYDIMLATRPTPEDPGGDEG